MKKSHLLIACFDVKDFQVIEKLNTQTYETIVVASDDYRVHELCSQVEYIDSVTFLQKPIPYTVVAKDVINIIQKINKYYHQISEEFGIFNAEYMAFPYHVEGGNSTQKIQDMLLYIQSIKMIVNQYKITDIIVCSNRNYQEIEQIVYRVCLLKDITCKQIKGFRMNYSKNRLKNIIRPFYYLFKTVSIKIENMFKSKYFERNVALFWFFNAVKKHIDNALFIDKVLTKSGLNPVLFSWRIVKVKNQSNLNIQPIEQYLSWKDIFMSVWKNIHIIIYQQKLMKAYSKFTFSYLGIELANIIYPIVQYHMLVEAADSYRFSKGFHVFKQYMDIKIIAGDLGRQKIGLLVENYFTDEIPKFAFTTFLTNKNIYVEYMRQQYSDKYWKNFRYFVQNEIEKNNLVSQVNINPEDVVVYGSFRTNTIDNNEKKDEVCLQLGISNTYDYYIMFDYPNQLNGYQSLEESVLTLVSMLDLVKERKDIALLIKPHPSANMSFFYSVKMKYKYPNIYFLEKTVNPISVLKIADILITKYSTLGIEAMNLNVIVISMQLDHSDAFRLYGEDGVYLDTILELKYKIGILIGDKNTFKRIKEKENKQNLKYFNSVYKKVDEEIVLQNINKLIED